MDELSRRLVPDELWVVVEPLIPPAPTRPQGGGRPRVVEDRAMFTAIVFVLTDGAAWRYLPPSFGVKYQTAHRRSADGPLPGYGHGSTRPCWTNWVRPVRSTGPALWRMPPACGPKRGISDRAEPRGPGGKPGSKIHALSDRNGLPLAVAVSAANTNDNQALKPLVRAFPAFESPRGPRRRKPAKLHADKAYDPAETRSWLRQRGIAPRIARRGIESSERLGRFRWVIERTMAWFSGYRRLTIRYERKASHLAAFLTLAAAITCFKRSSK